LNRGKIKQKACHTIPDEKSRIKKSSASEAPKQFFEPPFFPRE
jgi:hypothetical protein